MLSLSEGWPVGACPRSTAGPRSAWRRASLPRRAAGCRAGRPARGWRPASPRRGGCDGRGLHGGRPRALLTACCHATPTGCENSACMSICSSMLSMLFFKEHLFKSTACACVTSLDTRHRGHPILVPWTICGRPVALVWHATQSGGAVLGMGFLLDEVEGHSQREPPQHAGVAFFEVHLLLLQPAHQVLHTNVSNTR